MNIDGHGIVRREDGLIYFDGAYTNYGSSDPSFYDRRADGLRREAAMNALVAEFVRREAAEKAAQDAADELDRRAAIVRTTMRRHGWQFGPDFEVNIARQVVRALKADADAQAGGSE